MKEVRKGEGEGRRERESKIHASPGLVFSMWMLAWPCSLLKKLKYFHTIQPFLP